MSTWLAFDAGSPVTSAAVAQSGTVLAESSGESRTGPSLLHHMDDCLRRSGVARAGLDGILVLSGPGSFTGIRVALATALGLRAALAAPVVALSNLAALALHAHPDGDGRILALVDALRDEWFVQEFRRGQHGFVAIGDPHRVPNAALSPDKGVVFAAHNSQELPDRLAGSPVSRALALATQAATAASAGQLEGLLCEELQPLYLRAFTPRQPHPPPPRP